MRNYSEIFKKDVAYKSIKSKKSRVLPSLPLENTFLEKPQDVGRRGKLLPPPPSAAFLGLNLDIFTISMIRVG